VHDLNKVTQGRKSNDAFDFANLNFRTRRDVSGPSHVSKIYSLVDSKANYARSGDRRMTTKSTVNKLAARTLPNNADHKLGSYTRSSYSTGTSYIPLITIMAVISLMILVVAASLVGAAYFYSRKDKVSSSEQEALSSKSTQNPANKMVNLLKGRLNRPTTVDAERLPDDVLTVVIDSSDEDSSSSDEEEEFDGESSRESSYRAPSNVNSPAVPKLSIPQRKGTPYKQSRFALSEDDDDDDFNPEDDILGDDDEVSELPSTFSTDDYIDEAVANEKDPINVNPDGSSFIEPTQKFLSKIGRRFSVSQSALSSRFNNLTNRWSMPPVDALNLDGANNNAPESSDGVDSSDTNIKQAPATVAPLRLYNMAPAPEGQTHEGSPPQMRTRNQGLFSRISQAFSNLAISPEPVRLRDPDSMEEVALDSNRPRSAKSKLVDGEEPKEDEDEAEGDADE
jgi:hypothetical protein